MRYLMFGVYGSVHKFLSKDVHRFYSEFVKPNTEIYKEETELLEKGYNSVVRQTRVKNHLSAFRLAHYKNDSVDTADAMSIVYKRIISPSSQVPLSDRGDAHRVEFLYGAVVGYD